MSLNIYSLLLFCKNLDLTEKFYKNLGFNTERSDDALRIKFGDIRLAFMDEKDATIKDDQESKKGVGMYIYFKVDNVDLFFRSVKEKNIITSSEPRDWPWGKREFVIRDPDGYKLVFFSNIN
ncbi:MAG: VOC family protein [Candidatus Buchananbacteria bacterium]